MHLFINVPRPEKNIFWPITNLPDNRRLSALSRFVATCNPPGLVSPDYYVNALIIIKFSQRLLSRQITYYNKHAKCICLCTSAAHQTRPDRHPVTIGYSARERRIMRFVAIIICIPYLLSPLVIVIVCYCRHIITATWGWLSSNLCFAFLKIIYL